MNILIIGNGFDLAHGLQTRYTDFLKYCRDYSNDKPISESSKMSEEFLTFVNGNIWLKYFLDSTECLDDSKTWIDFEKEIAEVVHNLETANPTVERIGFLNNHPDEIVLGFPDDSISEKTEQFILELAKFDKQDKRFVITVSNITDRESLIRFLYSELRSFARAFEIYCVCKVNAANLDYLKSNDIKALATKIQQLEQNIKAVNPNMDSRSTAFVVIEQSENSSKSTSFGKATELLSEMKEKYNNLLALRVRNFDCVLSFNYTNTYETFYGDDKTKYCYIHGKAQDESSKTNIIFGIHDELSKGEESKNFTWVRFKKYYQKIIFQIKEEYKDWLGSNDNKSASPNHVYIVGHSLDMTDYEILYEFFNNKQFKMTVCYYSQDDFDDKVQKVIQLLAYKGANGRNELTRRMNGSQWSIRFVNQYDETEGLFNG